MRAFHHNLKAQSYGKIVLSTLYFGLWQNPVSYQGKKGRISLFPWYMYRGIRDKERPFHRTSNPREETDYGPLQMPTTTSLSSHFIFQTHTCPHPNLQETSSLPSPSLKPRASLSLACPTPSPTYTCPSSVFPWVLMTTCTSPGPFLCHCQDLCSRASADVRTCSSSLHPWRCSASWIQSWLRERQDIWGCR